MERLSYFDLHADTLTTLLRSDGTLERNALQASISGGRCFESYSQVWAIFTEPGVSYAASWERLRAALSHSARYLTPQSGTPDGDSYTPYLSIENATMVSRDTMEGDTEYLARCGVRLVAPVWRGENALGGAHNTAVGLTRLGEAFIREIMRRGMVPDVSHCSHESTAQIISAAEAAGSPAIASHSCSAALCGADRNLTDDEFSALVRIGGIVGVSLYPPHLDVSGHADAERAESMLSASAATSTVSSRLRTASTASATCLSSQTASSRSEHLPKRWSASFTETRRNSSTATDSSLSATESCAMRRPPCRRHSAA